MTETKMVQSYYFINNRYSDILNALFCVIYEEMLYQTNVSVTVYLSLWENFDQEAYT